MDADFEARVNALIAASDDAIWIESGDRDTETQTRLWNEAVDKYGPDEARNWVAPPGHSNHEKGIAVDFGGDMQLLAQLAPQYGIYQPMSWEPWHYEPMGSRSDDPQSRTVQPTDPSSLYRPTQPKTDIGAMMSTLLGLKGYTGAQDTSNEIALRQGGSDPIISGNPGFKPKEALDLPAPGPRVTVPGTGPRPSSYVPMGSTDLARFMAALRDVESSGNYQAEGVQTPWGTATGAYQYLDSTWNNYGGYARAKDAPPEVQDEKARADMQAYYDEYGSWDSVSAAWYSGPGGNWQSNEVQEYVGKVNSRL